MLVDDLAERVVAMTEISLKHACDRVLSRNASAHSSKHQQLHHYR